MPAAARTCRSSKTPAVIGRPSTAKPSGVSPNVRVDMAVFPWRLSVGDARKARRPPEVRVRIRPRARVGGSTSIWIQRYLFSACAAAEGRDQLRPVRRAGLGEHAGDVVLHGALGAVQPRRDGGVG